MKYLVSYATTASTCTQVARIQAPLHARPLRSTVRAAKSSDASVPGELSKTALRKLPKVMTIIVCHENKLLWPSPGSHGIHAYCATLWLISFKQVKLSLVLQATLESKLIQLGVDATGNKNALVERLMAASEQAATRAPVAATAQACWKCSLEACMHSSQLGLLQKRGHDCSTFHQFTTYSAGHAVMGMFVCAGRGV